MSGSRGRPLGQTIASILRSRIAALQYQDRFPTENELIREFEASRYAVRNALERLVSDGLIQRRAGRGTTIVDPAGDNAQWVIRTVEDLIDRNLNTEIEMLSAAPVPSSRHPDAARRFGLGPDTKLFLVERLARAGTAPHFYSLTYMPLDVGLGIRKLSIERRPIILLIEESRRIKAHRVQQETFARQASPRLARMLHLPSEGSAITVQRTYFERTGEVIVHGELHYPISQFHQAIELLRDPVQASGNEDR